MKKILKRAIITFLCLALFFGVAYAYLNYNFNKVIADADQKDYTVPYEKTPQNRGIAFVFPNKSAFIMYLDFDNMCIRVLNIPEFNEMQNKYSGYTADFTVQTSYELIEGIVDRVGGVELNYGEESLRYTGIQVIDIISRGCDDEFKKQLLAEIFKQIAKNNFSKDDFVYIIENSESDLSILDCIYWVDYIKEMSSRVSFVN